MSAPRRTILSLTSLLLGLLVFLLGVIAARQEAPVMSVQRSAVKFRSADGPSFQKQAAHKYARHTTPPAQKHHRARAHRVAVAKIAVPPAGHFTQLAIYCKERTPLSLAGVYRYVFFREITPPPPKDC